jgi:hypothetical protein
LPASPNDLRQNRRVTTWSGRALLAQLSQCNGDQRVAAIAPGIQATLERADALDAIFFEEERHTGARGFVRSSTVENHFAITRQTVVFLLQFLGVHAESAGNRSGLRIEIHGMAQVDDDEFFAGVNFFLEFVNGDA